MDAPVPDNDDPMVQDGTPQAHEGQPFIPNPFFANPAVYSQLFIPTATALKTRKEKRLSET